METSRSGRPHVVVLGGGFGGLAAVQTLKYASVRVTLIDHSNHHVFQPLLYEVATAGLEAPAVGYPLRSALRRQPNAQVLLAEATSIDATRQRVMLRNGDAVAYDYLIVATGVQTAYFGHPEWRRHATGLKSICDAIEMRYHVLTAFERAEQARDPDEQRALLRFVIVGGGPTGVELAGAIAELAKHALTRDFRQIDTAKAQILLLHGGTSILPSYPPELQRKAMEALRSLGVQVHTSATVSDVDEHGVTFGDEHVSTRTVLWAAGVRPTAVVRTLGAPLDRRGRVQVTRHLNPPGLANVFVIGDLAALEQDGCPLPGVAPAAMQEGRYAARAISHSVRGQRMYPFRYRNKGELAIIGRSRAVASLPGNIKISGWLAWLAYLGVHLFYLAGFRNRVSVFLSWAWSYATYGRGARLIPRRVPEEPPATASEIDAHPASPPLH
jgi:NADH dehydrogenase